MGQELRFYQIANQQALEEDHGYAEGLKQMLRSQAEGHARDASERDGKTYRITDTDKPIPFVQTDLEGNPAKPDPEMENAVLVGMRFEMEEVG